MVSSSLFDSISPSLPLKLLEFKPQVDCTKKKTGDNHTIKRDSACIRHKRKMHISEILQRYSSISEE